MSEPLPRCEHSDLPRLMCSCPACRKSWGGLRAEHCRACHETFTGTTAGDRHRVGKHDTWEGPDRRRCLTVDEMCEAGLVLKPNGVWGLPGTWRGPETEL